MAVPVRATLAEAERAPIPPGFRSAELMRHGSMVLRFYAPRGGDPQTPHEQDEIYLVARGRGTFYCGDKRGGRRVSFGPGDALFAPAGAAHRFEDFSDDFAAWVVFYGPKGGEHG